MKFNKSKSRQIKLRERLKEANKYLNTCISSRIIDLSEDLHEGKITKEQLGEILRKGFDCPNSVLGTIHVSISDNLVFLEQLYEIERINKELDEWYKIHC